MGGLSALMDGVKLPPVREVTSMSDYMCALISTILPALIEQPAALSDWLTLTRSMLELERRTAQRGGDGWKTAQSYMQRMLQRPAVQRVIACDLRRWRKAPLAAVRSGDWARFRSELRASRYDRVLDAQGLVKSAFLASRADGPTAGPDWSSAREPLASLFYRHRHAVPAHGREHAITRTRRLFAAALGYPLPADLDAPPDAGLDRQRFARPAIEQPYAVFLHGTTWPTKRWPLADWQGLARTLTGQGIAVMLPWGSEAERAEEELAPYRNRLGPQAFDQARRRAVDRLIRERFGLPAIAFE